MANLVLAFGEILVGAIVLDAGVKGDSIPNVIRGQATQHPLAASTGGTSAAGAASAAGNYQNPVPGASTGRIDQGVDYTLGSGGFLAPGRSQIIAADAHNAGWKGGGWITAKLLDGPLAGAVYYVAEGVAPAAGIVPGKIVDAGTQLVQRVTNPYNGALGNIEAGWANSAGTAPQAQSSPGYGGDQSTQALTAGYSFSKFVHALGGVAGAFQGAGQALEHTITAGVP
jgi:hypothetical protein